MSYTNITYVFLFFSLLGAQLISLNLGAFQLSPYRLILAISPFFLSGMFISALSKKRTIIRYEYVLFFALWILYSIASYVWVVDYGAWARSVVFLTGGFVVTTLIFSFISTYDQLESALRIVVCMAVAVGGLAIYEIISGNYLFLSAENRDFYEISSQIQSITGLRIPVTIFGNPNNYAIFLYISTIFCSILLRLSKSTFTRIIYVVILIFFFLLLFSTQSRAGIFGLLAFILISYLLDLYRKKSANKIASFFMLLFISIFFVLAFNDFFLLVGNLLSIDTTMAHMNSDTIRANLILNGFVFVYRSYFFGVGAGQVEEYMASEAVYSTGDILNMHNWWLEILTTSGVIIFAIYLIVYVRTAICSFRKYNDASSYRSSVVNGAVFCFLLSFAVGSVGPSSLMQNEWIWPLLALMMKAPSIQEKPTNFILNGSVQSSF